MGQLSKRENTSHPYFGAPLPTASSSADQIHAESYHAAGAQQISPAAMITAPPQNHLHVDVQTPKDVKYLGFVLDGRLEPPGRREEWVERMIEQLTRQAVEQEQHRLADNRRPGHVSRM